MNPLPVKSQPQLFKNILNILWKGRFIYLQLAILAGVTWLMWPLGETAALPNPPYPAYTPEPPDRQETLILCPETLLPGTAASARVVVYDPDDGLPIPGVEVRASMSPAAQSNPGAPLFAGETNDQGTAPIRFDVPIDAVGRYDLEFQVSSWIGEQHTTCPVRVEPTFRLDLTTDRATYAPGQTIHALLLVFDQTFGHAAPDLPIRFDVYDARDNRICTAQAATSEYGLAVADCALGPVVNEGTYRVVAALNDPVVTGERAVMVRSPSPLNLSLDVAPYALAGQPFAVRAQVNIHNRPVVSATVQIEARQLTQGEGITDESGVATVTLPGIVLDADGPDSVVLTLIASATAPDSRAAQQTATVPLARQSILLSAVPESEALEPGIENIVHLYARYPDGTPAQCDLDLTTPDGSLSLKTDAQGRAEWHITPSARRNTPLEQGDTPQSGNPVEIEIAAQDAQGHSGQAAVRLPVEAGSLGFLLRSDHLAYRAGEVMHVDILASFPIDAIYLDLIWNGQPVAAFSAWAIDQRAGFDISLDPVWIGYLVLRGYTVNGDMIADVRAVTVLPPGALDVSVQAGREAYPIGETAPLSIRIQDAPGKGVPAALTIAARNAAQPAPIQTAAYESNPLRSLPGAASTPRYAGAISKPRPMPEAIRQQFAAVDAARAARQMAFKVQATRWLWGLTVLAGTSWIVVLIGGWRGRWLNGHLLARNLFGGVLVLAFVAGAGALLAYGGQWLFGPGALMVLALCWFGALLALLVYGWLQRDRAAQVMAALLLGGLALGWGVREAATQGGAPLGAGAGVVIAVALALYLLGRGCIVRQQRSGALAAFALIALIWISAAGGLMSSTEIPAEIAAGQDTPQPTPTALPSLDGTPSRTPLEALIAHTMLPAQGHAQPRFDDTAFWQPAIPTDQQGNAVFNLPLPWDAVEWQVGVLAATQDGQIGFVEVPLHAVDPLPVEFALPTQLTVGDRIDVPVSMQNGAAISQTAGITINVPGWARLPRGKDVQQVEVGAQGQANLIVPLDVREWGEQTLNITAYIADILHPTGAQKTLTQTALVLPDGRRTARHYNRITGETDTYKIRIPWGVLRGTDRIAVYVDPTWASMLARGLDSALGHLNLGAWYEPIVVTPTRVSVPIACPHAFGGASLPQVIAEIDNLALLNDHLARTERLTLLLREDIARHAHDRYQHLLTFETPTGGFSIFAGGEATLSETASALRGLVELSALTQVDDETIDRVARWLLGRQEADGVWRSTALPPGWERFPRPELAFTAHVAWALIEAGYADAPSAVKSVALLAKYPDQAQEPYALAMVVHALLAYQEQAGVEEPALAAARARLIEMAQVEGGMARWHNSSSMPGGAVGESADLERTALAVWALIRAGSESEVIVQGLSALAQGRDALGAWGSPQTTAWALRALDAAVEAGIASPVVDDARMQVSTGAVAGGERISTPAAIITTDNTSDAGYVFYLDAPAKGYNDVRLEVEGGPVFYQLVAEYVEPWAQVSPPSPEEETIALTLSYDRTTLRVGETALVTVSVALNRPGIAPLVELHLGLPPGVDWIALDESQIAHFELEESAVRVYLTGLTADQPVTFAYRLRARLPSLTRTLPTWALDVANPQQPTFREPIIVEVVP
ncbi:MAG: hypothetical protein JW934_03955 [Anaerolineae bacterium]|nr:hypothetical protein [Anaerolineae bacterium]